jgi:hypothetical protein
LVDEGDRLGPIAARICAGNDDIVVVKTILAIGVAYGDDDVEVAVVVADSGGVDALRRGDGRLR